MEISQEEITKEDWEKKKAIESTERVFRQRKILSLISLFGFIFSFPLLIKFTKIFPSLYIILVLFLLIFNGIIFPPIYFIRKKKEKLLSKTIYKIIATTFVLELLCFFALLFLAAPLIIYYMGNIIFPTTLILIIYILFSNPIFHDKKYSYFFFGLSCLIIFTLAVFDYFNLFPPSLCFQIERFPYIDRDKIILISFISGSGVLFIIQLYSGNFWDMFRKQSEELRKLNVELEDRVKEKTKELQKRVNELERFYKLTVGRELRMKELKEEIERLKKELQEKNKEIEQLKKKMQENLS